MQKVKMLPLYSRQVPEDASTNAQTEDVTSEVKAGARGPINQMKKSLLSRLYSSLKIERFIYQLKSYLCDFFGIRQAKLYVHTDKEITDNCSAHTNISPTERVGSVFNKLPFN